MLKFVGEFKDLEKHGFKKRCSTWEVECKGEYNTTRLAIDGSKSKYRGIIHSLWWLVNEVAFDILYDLIKANLVVKVEE